MSSHPSRTRAFERWCVAAFGAFVLLGCGGSNLIPVTGKVTVDGQPLTSGWLRLHDGDGATIATAAIAGDGRFQFETSGKPGAPAGKYRVVVLPGVDAVFASQAKERSAAPPQAAPETIPREWSTADTTPVKMIVETDRSDYSLELSREVDSSTP